MFLPVLVDPIQNDRLALIMDFVLIHSLIVGLGRGLCSTGGIHVRALIDITLLTEIFTVKLARKLANCTNSHTNSTFLEKNRGKTLVVKNKQDLYR